MGRFKKTLLHFLQLLEWGLMGLVLVVGLLVYATEEGWLCTIDLRPKVTSPGRDYQTKLVWMCRGVDGKCEPQR